jgi:hypothetical protein
MRKKRARRNPESSTDNLWKALVLNGHKLMELPVYEEIRYKTSLIGVAKGR